MCNMWVKLSRRAGREAKEGMKEEKSSTEETTKRQRSGGMTEGGERNAGKECERNVRKDREVKREKGRLMEAD